jgi:hypothetical protein
MPKGKKGRSSAASLDRAKLFETLIAKPGLKTSELDKLLAADQLEIREALQEWESAGATHRTGRTRGTRWFVNEGATMPESLPPEAGEARKPARAARKARPARKAAAKPAGRAAAASRASRAPKAARGRGRPKGGKGRAPQAAILDKHRDLLGSVPDDVASERTGVPARTIQYYRKKHGIAGYAGPKRRGGAPASVASAPAEPAPNGHARRPAPSRSRGAARSAWRIEIRAGREVMNRYAFANSLTDAASLAAKAAASLGAEVVGLAWVGDSLD